MRSAFLVRVLKRALFTTKSVERADKSIFIWRDVQVGTAYIYELSLLGVINGFLRHTPRRLAVLGDRIFFVK